MSDAPIVPTYASKFCPILSHAVLTPPAPVAPPSALVAIGGELQPVTQPKAEAEYIGCQGNLCEWFVENESRCGVPLLAMGLGAIFAQAFLKTATVPTQTPPPTPTNSSH